MVAGNFVWRALGRSGANRVVRRLRASRLVIVCYHGVRADDSEVRHWLLMPRSRFAQQLDYLRSRFAVLPLDEALARLSAGALRGPTAAITFDDGYRNNYTIAWPELAKRDLPATVFLTTGLISTSHTLWTTTVEYAIRGAPIHEVDLAEWAGPTVVLDGLEARARAGYDVKEWLKELPGNRRQLVLDTLFRRLGSTEAAPSDFAIMSWDQVSELARSGLIQFGAHTVHHEILSRLDDATLGNELRESIDVVAERTGNASRVFAYPNGRPQDYDERAVRLLRSLAIQAALTTIPGTNSTTTPSWALRRLVVHPGMSFDRFTSEAGGVAALASDLARARITHRRVRADA